MATYLEIENQLPAIEDFIDESNIQMCYAGLSEEQIAKLAGDSLFNIHAHMVAHHFLTHCNRDKFSQEPILIS
jgi:hypothetical protein